MKMWNLAWEQLLNFSHDNDLLEKTGGNRIHIDRKLIGTHFKHDINSNKLLTDFKDGHVYSTRELHDVLSKYQQHPEISTAWKNVLQNIRKGYSRDKNDTPHFCNKNECINIVVHVRRGDSTNNKRRFVNHDYFVNCLKCITHWLDSRMINYSIQIYSEGKKDDLQEFEIFNKLTYRLNDDHFDTLHHMICADILIMSKSTFSYLPALLNENGVIVYKPFWLLPPKPLESNWIIADDAGNLNEDQIEIKIN